MRRPPAGPGAASGLRGREMAERAAYAVWRSVTRVRRGRERDAHRPRSPGQPLGREDPAARRNWCSDIAMGVEATERAFFSSYSCVLNHARLEKFAEGQLDARHRVGRRRTRTATRPQMAERTTRRGAPREIRQPLHDSPTRRAGRHSARTSRSAATGATRGIDLSRRPPQRPRNRAALIVCQPRRTPPARQHHGLKRQPLPRIKRSRSCGARIF